MNQNIFCSKCHRIPSQCTCSPQVRELTMNPDILPTLEEWRLICKMVKQQQAEIEKLKVILFELKNASLDLCKIVEKASEK